jgi:hypothetical protein
VSIRLPILFPRLNRDVVIDALERELGIAAIFRE